MSDELPSRVELAYKNEAFLDSDDARPLPASLYLREAPSFALAAAGPASGRPWR